MTDLDDPYEDHLEAMLDEREFWCPECQGSGWQCDEKDVCLTWRCGECGGSGIIMESE